MALANPATPSELLSSDDSLPNSDSPETSSWLASLPAGVSEHSAHLVDVGS
jgi:hypothetical protein